MRWGKDEFDLGHFEFGVPMSKPLSHGHRKRNRFGSCQHIDGCLKKRKSTNLEEISQDESGYVSSAAEKRNVKYPQGLAT